MVSFIRIVLLILGSISLALGIIGIFVPLLPTTPFLLLTAFLYFRSSPKAYRWLTQHKYLGSYIRDFTEHKIIPLKAKIISISVMWVSILTCVFVVMPKTFWWASVGLLAISAFVTLHILSYKSK